MDAKQQEQLAILEALAQRLFPNAPKVFAPDADSLKWRVNWPTGITRELPCPYTVEDSLLKAYEATSGHGPKNVSLDDLLS